MSKMHVGLKIFDHNESSPCFEDVINVLFFSVQKQGLLPAEESFIDLYKLNLFILGFGGQKHKLT